MKYFDRTLIILLSFFLIYLCKQLFPFFPLFVVIFGSSVENYSFIYYSMTNLLLLLTNFMMSKILYSWSSLSRVKFPNTPCLNLLYLGQDFRKCSTVSGASSQFWQIGEGSMPILNKWYLNVVWPVIICVAILNCFLFIFLKLFQALFLTFGHVIFVCLYSALASHLYERW